MKCKSRRSESGGNVDVAMVERGQTGIGDLASPDSPDLRADLLEAQADALDAAFLALTPDGLTLYVANSGSETISIVDPDKMQVTGRIGYVWDRFLGYVKGGAAWERDNYNRFDIVTGALVPIVTAASLGFLALLGAIGARAGGANVLRATLRVTFWGALAMALTAGIGTVL